MPHTFKSISVIGLGYIGLPTAAAFAARKTKVIGVDVNQRAVDVINQGRIHIVEPDLDMIVHAAVTDGYLRAVTHPENCDAYLIAVPTPFMGDHQPDLSFIQRAATDLAKVLKKGDLVILESTSPVGTTEKLSRWLSEIRSDLSFPHQNGEASDILVAYCPERVLPGRVMHELLQNDRIIGGLSRKSADAAVDLYKIFLIGECHVTDARTAELCKLTENASRDVSIAFANELSLVCDEHGVNVWELIKLANYHPRVNILQPGPGVGGHCIAVDPWFIISAAPASAKLMRTARDVNDGKPEWVVRKVLDALHRLKEMLPGREEFSVGCLGLAFKADIDDLRESPAVEIVHRLAAEPGVRALVVEPYVQELPASLKHSNVQLTDLGHALDNSDVLLILVDHKPFKAMAKEIAKHAAIVDTRGLVSRLAMAPSAQSSSALANS